MIKRKPLYRVHRSIYPWRGWHCYVIAKYGHRLNHDVGEWGKTPDEAREKCRATFQRMMKDVENEKIQRHW